ncbi:MAG: hypothetical protein AB7S99_12615, partial [Pseudodonghicola sp.]
AKAADDKLIDEMKAEGAIVHVAVGVELLRWRALTDEKGASFTEAHPEIVKALSDLEASCGLGG